MIAVNYSELRSNMKSYMDKASKDYESIIVTRKNHENVVILSEEAYNNLLENAYLLQDKANYDWLMESKKQLENSQAGTHKLIEDGKEG